jgi:hypothetical protein
MCGLKGFIIALAVALANEPKRIVHFPQGGHVNLDDFGAAKVIKEFLAGLPN